jgi:hypothetical protein
MLRAMKELLKIIDVKEKTFGDDNRYSKGNKHDRLFSRFAVRK